MRLSWRYPKDVAIDGFNVGFDDDPVNLESGEGGSPDPTDPASLRYHVDVPTPVRKVSIRARRGGFSGETSGVMVVYLETIQRIANVVPPAPTALAAPSDPGLQ